MMILIMCKDFVHFEKKIWEIRGKINSLVIFSRRIEEGKKFEENRGAVATLFKINRKMYLCYF